MGRHRQYRRSVLPARNSILTPRGEVPVETLSIGDEISTHDGQSVPIKWIGRRSFPREITARKSNVVPVVIRADALGDNVPVRDLRVSPEHAIFFDGVLVPAVNLVNGRTIVRELTVDLVEYFHIEVEGQAIVLADGAPAESYVNHNNRKMFANWPEYVSLYGEDEPHQMLANGQFERRYPCVTSGPVLETIRAEIDERDAAGFGFSGLAAKTPTGWALSRGPIPIFGSITRGRYEAGSRCVLDCRFYLLIFATAVTKRCM